MNKELFWEKIRASKIFGATISQSEVDNVEFILDAMTKANWGIAWMAYGLATAYHETATTMQPIRERGNYDYFENLYGINGKNPTRAKAMGNTQVGDGAKYCGRGFVQLTWKNNYLLAGDAIKIDLVANPELAMIPHHAAVIMCDGMEQGWFTGKGLKHYLLKTGIASKDQFIAARKIINGTDKADKIAQYAIIFQECLRGAL